MHRETLPTSVSFAISLLHPSASASLASVLYSVSAASVPQVFLHLLPPASSSPLQLDPELLFKLDLNPALGWTWFLCSVAASDSGDLPGNDLGGFAQMDLSSRMEQGGVMTACRRTTFWEENSKQLI
jgi:hypothetical protein